MDFSHRNVPHNRLNSGESDLNRETRPTSPASTLLSPYREGMRIPESQLYAQIPVESCKAYPIRLFDDLNMVPRIAYADLNTHGEQNELLVKLLPRGGKTASHSQLALFIRGPYHVETLGYVKSNPATWTTWMECMIDARQLKQLIEALIRIELKLQEVNTC